MPAPWMSGPVTATSGQPVTGWVQVTDIPNPVAAIYNASGGTAHMIVEGAYVVNNATAEAAETIFAGTDLPCVVGATVSLTLERCRFPFLRVSASSDSSSSVYGGVT